GGDGVGGTGHGGRRPRPRAGQGDGGDRVGVLQPGHREVGGGCGLVEGVGVPVGLVGVVGLDRQGGRGDVEGAVHEGDGVVGGGHGGRGGRGPSRVGDGLNRDDLVVAHGGDGGGTCGVVGGVGLRDGGGGVVGGDRQGGRGDVQGAVHEGDGVVGGGQPAR